MKYKVLKEHEGSKVGDIIDVQENGSEKDYIDNGYIKLIKDESYVKEQKDNKNETYYEKQLKEFNKIASSVDKKEFIKQIDFSENIKKNSDAKIIKGLRMFNDLPWEDEKDNYKIKEELDIKKAVTQYYGKEDLANKLFQARPFFYDKSKLWWLWNLDKKCWELVDETDILICVKNNVESVVTITSKERTEILEAMRQVGREYKPSPCKSSWLQFRDRIYDISDGTEFEATPKYFVTNPIPYQLHPLKHFLTPAMDKIFEEWVGKDNIQTLYEILAYSLLPDYPLHRIFCFIGGGMNGKSKFLDLLRRFVGHDNCCSTELDTLLNSRFEVTRLHKKLVCQMGETNFNEMSKTSILKKLSGGDLIGFEYKNKNPFEEHNYAKILIATNNLPATTDKTIGFYRRWIIIDFPNQFSEKKDILADIPEEEYECLAVKCTMILNDILKNREFTNEGSVEERMERYEEKSNPLNKFLKEFCETDDPNEYATKNNFALKLNGWLKNNGHREMGTVTITQIMKTLGFENGVKRIEWNYDGESKSKTARVWFGVRLKE